MEHYSSSDKNIVEMLLNSTPPGATNDGIINIGGDDIDMNFVREESKRLVSNRRLAKKYIEQNAKKANQFTNSVSDELIASTANHGNVNTNELIEKYAKQLSNHEAISLRKKFTVVTVNGTNGKIKKQHVDRITTESLCNLLGLQVGSEIIVVETVNCVNLFYSTSPQRRVKKKVTTLLQKYWSADANSVPISSFGFFDLRGDAFIDGLGLPNKL